MGARINVRVDEALALKLERLRQTTGENTSAILKAALEAYYEQVSQTRQRPGDILREVGFVGCGSADPELSSNYKQELTQAFEEKFGVS